MTTSAATADKANLSVTAITQFDDNYAWLLHNDKHAWIIDPGQAAPIVDTLNHLGLTLKGMLVTHCHWDHVSGIAALKKFNSVPVYGTQGSHPEITHAVNEGTSLFLNNTTLFVWQTPGHMADHLSFYIPEQQWLFCGDTLFFAGCGRLKQTGNMTDLYNSTQRIGQLPKDTQVFCSHEYTLANLAFAASIEPQNTDIQNQIKRVQDLRKADKPSIPSTVDIELSCNPFLRLDEKNIRDKLNISDTCDTYQVFKALRELKDKF